MIEKVYIEEEGDGERHFRGDLCVTFEQESDGLTVIPQYVFNVILNLIFSMFQYFSSSPPHCLFFYCTHEQLGLSIRSTSLSFRINVHGQV